MYNDPNFTARTSSHWVEREVSSAEDSGEQPWNQSNGESDNGEGGYRPSSGSKEVQPSSIRSTELKGL